jgi:Arc/MetJ family transcription regulator
MKTTIEMPDDLFRKAKAIAALRGQSMKQLITQLLQREIGAPLARTASARKKGANSFSQELEALATQVSKEWETGLSATDAVQEQRRG